MVCRTIHRQRDSRHKINTTEKELARRGAVHVCTGDVDQWWLSVRLAYQYVTVDRMLVALNLRWQSRVVQHRDVSEPQQNVRHGSRGEAD
jgi:hypothetical protein